LASVVNGEERQRISRIDGFEACVMLIDPCAEFRQISRVDVVTQQSVHRPMMNER
jgi:hypothetical protein